ncbi:hypothetical protein GUITHDRAFT_159152 [Guillardia theta CCMP2712]|uniref:NADPH--hemoprotein reductase n=1 Tax=Guillardia theta (strain CCMP2712) TaxID=905079 RepID=L1K2I2_GUITC|nr:hypothetical protein GUITHDRAFT_159152 [Guillardia theta CCMP2712]EKX54670.1 hypothetical protein GUITHDRAFT_159152 [Guillardia theta CCMP2712]|eukprot:XP_005841650.1 hypothetical protein GUITHDRAFT_159152 [Guillardia theta CCMP2712]
MLPHSLAQFFHLRPAGPGALLTAATEQVRIDVYFGSQTGTAEEFALTIQKEGKMNGFDVKVIDLQSYDVDTLDSSNSIFVTATYGEGDPTDNAKEFVEWLVHKADPDSLKGMQFAVFGLGNSQYENYNTVGKTIDSHCERLGATRIMELGLGDDDKDIQQDFEEWKEKLWRTLHAHFDVDRVKEKCKTVETEISRKDIREKEHKYKLEVVSERTAMEFPQSSSVHSLDTNPMVNMTVTCNDELNKCTDRSCRHIELALNNSGLVYETGDHVAILPDNDPHDVEELAQRLGVSLSSWIYLVDDDSSSPFPCPCTVQKALCNYVDINGMPKRSFIEHLAMKAIDSNEKRRLETIAGRDDASVYQQYICEGRRNVLDLLREFPSVKLSLHDLLESLPRLQPRFYSISSGSNTHPESAHVTAVVVDDILPEGRRFKGVCTNFLKQTKETTFKLPNDSRTPVIMIGAGTGLAPLRGMCQHLETCSARGDELGHNVLIFGCRSSKQDYIYEDEINRWCQNKTISSLFLAFSRENPQQKVYVQNRVRENSQLLVDLIEKGAYIYVCGSTSMAKEVKRAFVGCFQDTRQMSTVEAEDLVHSLSKGGRYLQDVWS